MIVGMVETAVLASEVAIQLFGLVVTAGVLALKYKLASATWGF